MTQKFEALKNFLKPIEKFLHSETHAVVYDGDTEIEALIVNDQSEFLGLMSGNCIYELYSSEECGHIPVDAVKADIQARLFVMESIEWTK